MRTHLKVAKRLAGLTAKLPIHIRRRKGSPPLKDLLNPPKTNKPADRLEQIREGYAQ